VAPEFGIERRGLILDRVVPVLLAPLRYRLHTASKAFAYRPNVNREPPPSAARTDVREAEKVEGRRLGPICKSGPTAMPSLSWTGRKIFAEASARQPHWLATSTQSPVRSFGRMTPSSSWRACQSSGTSPVPHSDDLRSPWRKGCSVRVAGQSACRAESVAHTAQSRSWARQSSLGFQVRYTRTSHWSGALKYSARALCATVHVRRWVDRACEVSFAGANTGMVWIILRTTARYPSVHDNPTRNLSVGDSVAATLGATLTTQKGHHQELSGKLMMRIPVFPEKFWRKNRFSLAASGLSGRRYFKLAEPSK